MKGFSVKHQYYGKQKDAVSCGFFVYSYIKSILTIGNASELNRINVTLLTLISNPFLLEDTINGNFSVVKPDARKITETGNPISWEKASWMHELSEDYMQILQDLDSYLDANEEDEEETEQAKEQEGLNAPNLVGAGLFKVYSFCRRRRKSF